MPKYRIKPGYSFVTPDNKVAHAGAVIDLDSDVAKLNARALDEVADEVVDEVADGATDHPIELAADAPVDDATAGS